MYGFVILVPKRTGVLALSDSKKRAPRNRTVTLTDEERDHFSLRLVKLDTPVSAESIMNCTIHEDLFAVLDRLPSQFANLIFADPPYNISKQFNQRAFDARSLSEYEEWLELWLPKMKRLLKPSGSIYICGDWRSSAAIHKVAQKHFVIRNRITWEREKGRGAKTNWKNASEDIWFCTASTEYVFNVNEVKLKRRVIAPYTDQKGKPKDWKETQNGRYRLTHPSNLWTDISVPFWSMPENTDHPTQKPEKLLAKIILASSNPGDVVFDPFLGSGTTSVVAKKLNRQYIGVEIDKEYCCLAEKRLCLASSDTTIQGYSDGVFWERNTLANQSSSQNKADNGQNVVSQPTLFE